MRRYGSIDGGSARRAARRLGRGHGVRLPRRWHQRHFRGAAHAPKARALHSSSARRGGRVRRRRVQSTRHGARARRERRRRGDGFAVEKRMTTPTSGTAPGHPGVDARWTSSAKSGVGTDSGSRSRVWFTISHGIVDEVYYPRVDQANTRDFGLLVTDGDVYFSEEKRDAQSEVELLADGVPGYRLCNRSLDDRYRIIKTIVTDPERDVLLQEIQFEP